MDAVEALPDLWIVAVAEICRPRMVGLPSLEGDDRVVSFERRGEAGFQFRTRRGVRWSREMSGGLPAGGGNVGVEEPILKVAPAGRARHGLAGDECGEGCLEVAGGASEPAWCIKSGRERKRIADPWIAGGKAETEKAAEGGWHADGAPRITSKGERSDPGRNDCGGTAAGPAGRASRKLGVFAVAVMGVLSSDAVGEFMQLGFPDENCALLVERLGKGAVDGQRRPHFWQEGGPSECDRAGHVEKVLGKIRDATERSLARRGGKASGDLIDGGEVGNRRPLLGGREAAPDAVVDFVRGLRRREFLPCREVHQKIILKTLARGNSRLSLLLSLLALTPRALFSNHAISV